MSKRPGPISCVPCSKLLIVPLPRRDPPTPPRMDSPEQHMDHTREEVDSEVSEPPNPGMDHTRTTVKIERDKEKIKVTLKGKSCKVVEINIED